MTQGFKKASEEKRGKTKEGILMRAKTRDSARPSTLLVMGDLALATRHRERLRPLVQRVSSHRGKDIQQVENRLKNVDFLFACNVPLTPCIETLAALRLVVLAETGIVHIDEQQAMAAGVNYTNIPGYSTEAVVQYILRCMFESLRPWEKIFSPTTFKIKEEKIGRGLEGAKIGLVGYGLIGKRLAEVLATLGCEVYINTRRPFRSIHVKWLPLKQLFSRSDIVVICCARDDASRGLIDAGVLGCLCRNTTLISISHREVFDNEGLYRTLAKRTDVSAWLDFDWQENDSRFMALPHVRVSPHLAFYTEQTLEKRIDSCIDQLESFLGK